MQKNHDNYDYVSCDVIRRFINGDSKAFEIVMKRYENYLHRCLTADAWKYGINPKDLELQDLKQVVWMEYDQIMKKKFRNKRDKSKTITR